MEVRIGDGLNAGGNAAQGCGRLALFIAAGLHHDATHSGFEVQGRGRRGGEPCPTRELIIGIPFLMRRTMTPDR
jgi:hypothetical protein